LLLLPTLLLVVAVKGIGANVRRKGVAPAAPTAAAALSLLLPIRRRPVLLGEYARGGLSVGGK
jgi:hypothetical protein